MTELEHIEIEGFKGLEHVEFEPTDINLITGRNNTGKTSLLEAVDLLFDSSNITEFSDNLDKVVNIEFNQSNIQGEISGEEVELQMRYPNEQEANEYFVKALAMLLSSAVQWHLDEENGMIVGQDTPPDWIDEGVFYANLEKAARRTVDETELADINKKCVALEPDGGLIPCVYFGNLQHKLLMDGLDELERILRHESQKLNLDESSLGKFKAEIGTTEARLSFRPESVSNTPIIFSGLRSRDDVRFITSKELSIEVNKKEEKGIKIDDIGDFIRSSGLVDNLKTFTLDYLIFDEGGDKYDIPYEFMGDGFKSIVGLLWELMDDEVENEIALIEEPENHMHPGYIREVVYFFIKLAREEDVQLFITTHDSDFINDFFTENLTNEEEAYLEDEFSLLRMEEDSAVVEDYGTARENLKELHLDLRGI